jgi:heat-inducible transcriptional repressor
MSELGDRQAAILRAVVREYIRSAEPVGSKHLVGTYHLNVSPATVRNDMALLEELGYLAQPHTSAGRIPTDRGYRYFVDSGPPAKLGKPNERRLSEEISAEPTDLEELLRRASDALSRFTSYAAAVLTPRLQTSRLRHLDVAWLAPRVAVVVLIADGGRVEKRTIELHADISEPDLDHAADSLNRNLGGLRLDDAEAKADALAEKAPDAERALIEGVADAIATLVEAEQRVILGGTSNLADERTVVAPEELRKVYEVIDRPSDLRRVLSDAESPASVRIGSELEVEGLRSWSVVVAPYGADASVGVIGPTRMDYLRAMASVSLVARILEDTIRDLST